MSETASRRGVGRPAKVDRQMIAEAAHDIGLSGLTMKAVADRLGVSVPGLYHHIDGKDDLLRLAAEYSAAKIELPRDHGQHWAVWLYEWAVYTRDAFVDQPEVLKQYLEGAIGPDRTAASYETALARLVAEGFTVAEAMAAYSAVSEHALGAAVNAIREQRAVAAGRPAMAEFHRVLAQQPRDAFPQVRAMIARLTTDPIDEFHEGTLIVLRGIAEQRGARWATVRNKLRAAEKKAS